MTGTGGRDLSYCVDRFGNIAVHVVIGGGPGNAETRETGASNAPAIVAGFLRDLADDVGRVRDEQEKAQAAS
jgi:hypothetical protein